jgi:hypothetical protein
MKGMNRNVRLAAPIVLLGAVCGLATASGPISVGHLYELSDFTGTIPYTDATVVADPVHDEAYTLFANDVRVFNGTGMQIYSFSLDSAKGQIVDLAVDDRGDLLTLIYAPVGPDGRAPWALARADYRGRPLGPIALAIPDGLATFNPNRLVLRAGTIWLASTTQMIAASFSSDGAFLRTIDLAEVAGVAPADRDSVGIRGFDVGPSGSVLFAVPTLFRVHVVAADGTTRSFGKVGSGAGNFGIVAGVAWDGNGNIIVSDRLRNVVMVFDEEFRFLREFGQSGSAKTRVTRPGGLSVGAGGKIYVSQLGNRGIAVFAMDPEK